ncbi:MAG: hypothetical protein AB7O98_07145 [Hyphomonadaceae bacterium]
MKFVIGAAAIGLFLATPAFAQTETPAQCQFTAAPTLINGGESTREAMTEAGDAINAWLTARQQQQEPACQQAIAAQQANLQAMEAAYNAAGAERTGVVQTWNAQLAAINGGGRAPATQLPTPAPAAGAQCTFSPPPSLAVSGRAAATAKTQEVAAWDTQRQQQEQTCRTEIERVRGNLQTMAAAFNASNTERQSIVQAWNAEVQEFGSRPAPARRERGGVLTRPDD